jgi:hypothetical protein
MIKFDQKEAAFCKKRRKNSFESGAWALRIPTPRTQIQRVFLLRAGRPGFSSEKEVLACC